MLKCYELFIIRARKSSAQKWILRIRTHAALNSKFSIELCTSAITLMVVFFLLTRFYLSCVLMQEKKCFILFRVFDYFVWLFNICCICGAVSNDRVDKQTHKKWLVNIWGRYVFFPLLIHTPIISQLQQKQQQKIRTNPYTRRQIIIDFFVLFYSSFCAKSTRSVSNTNRQKKMCFK